MKRIKESRKQDEPLRMGLTRDGDEKRALVLAGGGAKSIFQAQVVRRLRQAGYSFDIISGVSAGSLNAAIMSQKKGNVVELWKGVEKDTLFTGGLGLWNLLKVVFGYRKSVYNNSGLEKLLREEYDPANTKIPFIIGSVNLHTAEYNEYTITAESELNNWRRKEIYRSVIASISIPLLFPPISNVGKEQEHLFADGGLRNIAPLSSVIHKDVEEILVITTSPRHLGTTEKSLNSAFEIAERSFDILLNEIIREDIDSVLKVNRLVKQCDGEPKRAEGGKYRHIPISLIEPRFGLGGMLDFSDEIQEKRIEEANNVCNMILSN